MARNNDKRVAKVDKDAIVRSAIKRANLFPEGWVPNSFTEYVEAHEEDYGFQRASRGYQSYAALQVPYLTSVLSNGTGQKLSVDIPKLVATNVRMVREIHGTTSILRNVALLSGMEERPADFAFLHRVDALWVEWINEAVARSIFTLVREQGKTEHLDDMIDVVCGVGIDHSFLPLDKNLIRHLLAGLGDFTYADNDYWRGSSESGARILALMKTRRDETRGSEHSTRYVSMAKKLRKMQSAHISQPTVSPLLTPREATKRVSPDRTCPNPLKRVHATAGQAWEFIDQHHKGDDRMVPYSCICGVLHIGHTDSPKRLKRTPQTTLAL